MELFRFLWQASFHQLVSNVDQIVIVSTLQNTLDLWSMEEFIKGPLVQVEAEMICCSAYATSSLFCFSQFMIIVAGPMISYGDFVQVMWSVFYKAAHTQISIKSILKMKSCKLFVSQRQCNWVRLPIFYKFCSHTFLPEPTLLDPSHWSWKVRVLNISNRLAALHSQAEAK